ncbi:MAG: FAD-dependent oxidoreductase, partial [Janthinobacterium lividum]
MHGARARRHDGAQHAGRGALGRGAAMTPHTCDLLIVGAGPAGMQAALTARRHGLSVIVADEAPTAGGQIYRAAADSPLARPQTLGPDY